MSGEVRYGKSWNFGSGLPIDEVSRDQAYSRNGRGQPYSVGFVDTPGLAQVLQVNWGQGNLSANFLDEFGRVSSKYTFYMSKQNVLFLGDVVMFEYSTSGYVDPAYSDAIVSYLYTSDGSMTEVVSPQGGGLDKVTEFFDVDLSANFEPIPDFGDWDSIRRYDR
ncbi:hypothetical protein [Nocardia neocaledoniensis]|uniref:hypothetical protein n=1 Tax=Nocardia neocaledoniensis TaxID=236511 RepID=UPI0011B56C26|nr:hypothetical protein [Nocardia neocaledoniensis]